MNKVMLMYPPGKLYQRSEDRAQCNIEYSSAGSIHACNDLGYCAAILRQSGYEVFLQDYEMERSTLSNVVKDILLFGPDLLFMSTTNATIKEDLKIISYLRQFATFKVVIKGALFYDVDMALLNKLQLTLIDCLIGGEVEFIIAPLCDVLLRGNGKLCDIAGIVYRENGKWCKTAFDCWHKNLDILPFPARDLMHNELYVRPDTGEPMATISVARGCPSQCIYCLTPIISGKKVRFRSVENVFAEIEECYYKFGIKNFFFKADTFTINEAFAIAVCDRIIRSDLHGKIAFTANSRVKPLSMQLLKKMKQAGCFMLAVGFESGSASTLKKIKKGTTVADNLLAAKMIHQAGIPLFGFFMIGFPWETEKQMRKTIHHILQIKPDFAEISMAMPYYGTTLFKMSVKEGLLNDTDFGLGHDYFLMPNTVGTNYVSLKKMKNLRKFALLKFYTRPLFLAKKAVDVCHKPVVLKNYVRYGVRLIKNLTIS